MGEVGIKKQDEHKQVCTSIGHFRKNNSGNWKRKKPDLNNIGQITIKIFLDTILKLRLIELIHSLSHHQLFHKVLFHFNCSIQLVKDSKQSVKGAMQINAVTRASEGVVVAERLVVEDTVAMIH